MIGSLAGILTTVAFVPQVVKILKTKETSSISIQTCLMQVVGVFLWLIHGLFKGDVPLIAANSITLGLTLIITICKLRYSSESVLKNRKA
ncbi:SemiSWEET transporter [Carnobacterium gallinarum]|uniref:SemiSWEET transporter n=1 Tax=Carnobacterium gallinarum TaxID=2749 RepID=UPI000551BDCC|nr:SemiSWEET transporter [Carnobacterium gallinarum]